MKLRISESMEYDSADESLGDAFGFKSDDICGSQHRENFEPLPFPSSERGIRAIPLQYERADPDREVLNERARKKWTEEREACIGAWEDVTGLFSDVLAVRVIQKSTCYAHDESVPQEPDSSKKVVVSENYLKRLKRSFGEVKDLFGIFGCQSLPARKTCPNRKA